MRRYRDDYDALLADADSARRRAPSILAQIEAAQAPTPRGFVAFCQLHFTRQVAAETLPR